MANKGWWVIDLNATSETTPFIETTLESLGAVAVTLADAEDQPLFSHESGCTPLWGSIQITALFPHNIPRQSLDTILKKSFPKNVLTSLTVSTMVNDDWISKWNKSLQVKVVTERLWLCPSHCELPKEAPIPLILDPGFSFGSGEHPSTYLCLKWLDQHIKPGMQCIDYGCGSGILAIAALKLGASICYAVDTAPQALKASRDNAEANSIDAKSMPVSLPEDLPKIKADCIMANIVASVLSKLPQLFKRHLNPEGKLILSGMLAKQGGALIHHYCDHGFAFLSQKQEGDWLMLAFKLQSTES